MGPDSAMTPFRSEKNTNWEGAFRIPMVVRWPGQIKAGQVSNEIVQHHDWFPGRRAGRCGKCAVGGACAPTGAASTRVAMVA